MGEVLILKGEPDNSRDVHTVAVLREGQVVGQPGSKGFVEVTGARVNRGATYGLEIHVNTDCMVLKYTMTN